MFEKRIFDEKINNVLIDFSQVVSDTLGGNLASIIIYGSVALDDFKHGKGDIDFVCVTHKSLTEKEIDLLTNNHREIRAGSLGELGKQIEGSYYPKKIFENEENKIGLYIGTNQNNWRTISSIQLNLFDQHIIRKHGIVIYGEDNRHIFYKSSFEELKQEYLNELKNRIDSIEEYKDIEFNIETIYFALRGFNTILKKSFISKSESCKWYIDNFEDLNYIDLIKHIRHYRYPLSSEDKYTINSDLIFNKTKPFLEHIYNLINE